MDLNIENTVIKQDITSIKEQCIDLGITIDQYIEIRRLEILNDIFETLAEIKDNSEKMV